MAERTKIVRVLARELKLDDIVVGYGEVCNDFEWDSYDHEEEFEIHFSGGPFGADEKVKFKILDVVDVVESD